jgi:hypothetical protein
LLRAFRIPWQKNRVEHNDVHKAAGCRDAETDQERSTDTMFKAVLRDARSNGGREHDANERQSCQQTYVNDSQDGRLHHSRRRD